MTNNFGQQKRNKTKKEEPSDTLIDTQSHSNQTSTIN